MTTPPLFWPATRAATRVAIASLLAAGCSLGQAPQSRYEFGVRVLSDDGSPIAGAQIAGVSGAGATDESGEAAAWLVGREGERRSLNVICPARDDASARPLMVTLFRTNDPSRRPVYTAECARRTRTVVIGIRVENGPNLPIRFLGEEIARTNATGVSHALLHVPPGEHFALTVDTSSDSGLRPANPVHEFAIESSDALLLLDQKLTAPVRNPTNRVHRPIRVDHPELLPPAPSPRDPRPLQPGGAR